MAITQEQVNTVCEQLQEEGDNPTLAAVRAELGSGSMATIARMVRAWREAGGQATRSAEAQSTAETPEVIQALAQKMAAGMWAEAERLAEQRLEAERAAMKAELAGAKRELEDAYAEMEEMARQIQNLQKVQEEAFEQFKRMKKQIESLEAETQAAREMTAAAEGRASQAEKLCRVMMDGIAKLKEKPAEVATKKKASVKTGQDVGAVDTKTQPLVL